MFAVIGYGMQPATVNTTPVQTETSEVKESCRPRMVTVANRHCMSGRIISFTCFMRHIRLQSSLLVEHNYVQIAAMVANVFRV